MADELHLAKTAVEGVYVINLAKVADDRGWFTQLWCDENFKNAGLVHEFDQTATSFSPSRGTLRGLHWQIEPFQQTKLIRCIRGQVYDIVVDLRPNSSTYLKWTANLLSADNYQNLYVPRGCAHAFLTLEPNCEILYHTEGLYRPDLMRGVRWSDPQFAFSWPENPTIISKRDDTYPDFVESVLYN